MSKNSIGYNLYEDCQTFNNTKQEIILIPKDKLENILIKHQNCLNNSKEWLTPLGLFLSCVATLFATDFKDFLLPAAVWHAIFVIICVASLAWLVYSGIKALLNMKNTGMDVLIKKIKNTE